MSILGHLFYCLYQYRLMKYSVVHKSTVTLFYCFISFYVPGFIVHYLFIYYRFLRLLEKFSSLRFGITLFLQGPLTSFL